MPGGGCSVRVWRRCWQRERKGGRGKGRSGVTYAEALGSQLSVTSMSETDEMVTQAGEFTCGGELGVE